MKAWARYNMPKRPQAVADAGEFLTACRASPTAFVKVGSASTSSTEGGSTAFLIRQTYQPAAAAAATTHRARRVRQRPGPPNPPSSGPEGSLVGLVMRSAPSSLFRGQR